MEGSDNELANVRAHTSPSGTPLHTNTHTPCPRARTAVTKTIKAGAHDLVPLVRLGKRVPFCGGGEQQRRGKKILIKHNGPHTGAASLTSVDRERGFACLGAVGGPADGQPGVLPAGAKRGLLPIAVVHVEVARNKLAIKGHIGTIWAKGRGSGKRDGCDTRNRIG